MPKKKTTKKAAKSAKKTTAKKTTKKVAAKKKQARKKMGKRKGFTPGGLYPFSFSTTPERRERIREYSAMKMMNVSFIVREMLESYLKDRVEEGLEYEREKGAVRYRGRIDGGVKPVIVNVSVSHDMLMRIDYYCDQNKMSSSMFQRAAEDEYFKGKGIKL